MSLSVKFVNQPPSNGYYFERINYISYRSIRDKQGKVPKIAINGIEGRKLVRIQLVSKNVPHGPHPFALIGDHCENGVYTHFVNDKYQIVTLDNIGIQYFYPNENEEALEFRRTNNLDPFGTGFSTSYLKYIDYFRVRLCVTVKNEESGNGEIMKPIMSDPIYDDLPICDSCYFRLRTGIFPLSLTTSTYDLQALKRDMLISMEEDRNRQPERTDPYSLVGRSNNVPAVLERGRFPSHRTSHRNELLDRNQRTYFNTRTP